MGSCFSSPTRSHGQRLGSTAASYSAPAPSGSGGGGPSREERAAAAEARRQAEAVRGTGKQGPGKLAKQLEQETRAGGTGGGPQALPERAVWD